MWFVVLVLLMVFAMGFLGWSSQAAPALGVSGNRLAALAEKPNGVSTQATNEMHKMDALDYQSDLEAAIQRIQTVVEEETSAKLVESKENYLRYEFRSTLFRFVDDVEFLVDVATNKIHFRSASRVGHSDMGANRKRMERITKAFKTATKN